MTDFERSALCGPLFEERLLAFERRLGRSLPLDYREFMLRFNGGIPRNRSLKYFHADEEQWIDTELECFLALHDQAIPDDYARRCEESLEQIYDQILQPNGLAETIVPIGRDVAGNLVVLDLAADGGRILFYDHDYDELYDLAESSFLNLCSAS